VKNRRSRWVLAVLLTAVFLSTCCSRANAQYFLVGIGLDYGYMIATIPSTDMKPQAGIPYTESCPAVELNGSLVKLGVQVHY